MSAPSRKTWTLILAAGASSRFGSPKALAIWQEQTLLECAVKTARNFSGEKTMVVVGGNAETLKPYLTQVKFAHNERWSDGMSTSIITGVNAIRSQAPDVEMILILPVDQPLVEATHLQNLEKESQISNCCALTRNSEGVMGAPAALPKAFFSRVNELRGDRGLKSILKESEIKTVECSKALIDVDHPDDLKNLKK